MQQFSEVELNLLWAQISAHNQLAQNLPVSHNCQRKLDVCKLIMNKPRRRCLPTLAEVSRIPAQVFVDQRRQRVANWMSAVNEYANAYRREKHQTLYEARFTDRVENKFKMEQIKRMQVFKQQFLSEVLKQQHKRKYLQHAKELLARKLKEELLATKEPNKEEMDELELDEERMRCLLAEDEVRYRQLIDKKKNKRLAHLVEQTDEFLRKLTQMVKRHKNEHCLKNNTKPNRHERRLCKYETLWTGKYMDEENIDAIVANERVTVKNMKSKLCLRNEEAPKLKNLFEFLKANPDWYWDAGQTDDEEDEEETFAPEQELDYYSTVHTQLESIKQQASIMLNGKLKEYQLKGLEWLVSLYNNNLNGILADEMGLGKTIQTIGLITYLMEQKKLLGPYLIIVPLSTLANWELEFGKWAPSVTLISYRGSPQNRKQLHKKLQAQNFNVVLTTYEYVIKDRPVLAKLHWKYMIVDEGHRMKNPQCKLTGVLNTYYHRTSHRLLLTGTPLQNKLPELWALLNFLLPSIFNCSASFEQWFNAPFANIGETVELNEEETILIIRRLHSVLRPFLLRRLKKEVEHQLPEKVEYVIKCEMSALQNAIYQEMQSKGRLLNSFNKSGQNIKMKKLLNTLIQLRKICNHPFMFPHIENLYSANIQRQVNGTDLYRVSGKFELLDRILPKLKASNHRVLLFCQMTQCMTILEDYLTWCEIQYLRLDGSTKSEERGVLLAKFNDPQSQYFLFLLSTRAGGLGLNLQAADTVIIFDSDWNPHQDLQAQDRAHRIGQCNEVRVLRLVTINTVEERILMSARNKLSMDEKVIQAGMFDQKSTESQRKHLLETILKQNDMNEDYEIPNDDTINTMLARTEHEIELFKRMDIERKQNIDSKLPFGRLVQDIELPEFIISCSDDEENKLQTVENTERVTRLRKKTKYPEAMNEDEFLKAINASDDESKTIIRKSKLRTTRQTAETSVKSGKKGLPSQSLLHEILQNVIDYKDEDGYVVASAFIKLPTKRTLPDYYQVIKKPIDIKKMQQRINDEVYLNLNDFKKDFMLLCKNARVYNEDESDIYKNSIILQNVFVDAFERLTQNKKQSEPNNICVNKRSSRKRKRCS